ncbi:MAG: hypothetical protein ACTSSH_11320 [Candidatus Heimdallarchaeota archaeon]
MTDYLINDDWVLERVSKESTSFKGWVSNLIDTVSKAIGETRPDIAEKLKQEKKELPELVGTDAKLDEIETKIKAATNKIKGLGSLGGYISNLTSNIQGYIAKNLQNISGLDPMIDSDINIDFITGKRKSLSSTLYDVAKERGIKSEGILYLIQSLPDLESFLYSTSAGKYYRDHTEHQLRVAVLGDFLLEQDIGHGTLLNHIADLTELDKNHLKDEIWWITGLIHDIGYPLQKMTTSINFALLNQILKCYPMLDFDVVPFEINLSNKKLKPYLDILEEGLSKEAKNLIRKGSGFNFEVIPQPKTEHFPSVGVTREEYKPESEIFLDHGVVGAISLLRSLGSPEDILENSDELQGFIKAAQAIALHNFKDKLPEHVFDNNPLAFLLVLIDELQEWSRPIPLQIRDSYFTTELKKITLLDEIHLAIDDVQWLMAYKKMDAKELTNFKFDLFCQSKNLAFGRLFRGKEFPKSRIVIQDYEVSKIEYENGKTPEKLIESLTSELVVEETGDDKAKKKSSAEKELLKELYDKSKMALQSLKGQKQEEHELSKQRRKYQEKLLSEFYIVI